MDSRRTVVISMRLPEGAKERLRRAAEASGRTITSFVLEAASKHADAILGAVSEETPVCNEVPLDFQGMCRDVQSGGTNLTYEHVGYWLARHIKRRDLVPRNVDLDRWMQELDGLENVARNGRDREILDWFLVHYAPCMQFIPARQRGQFANGVREWARASS